MRKILTTILVIALAPLCILIFNIGILYEEVEGIFNSSDIPKKGNKNA